MKLWIRATDNDWFEYLAPNELGEVNFWQPSGRKPTPALAPSIPFLYKLHAPYNFIVGGTTSLFQGQARSRLCT